MTQLIPDLSVVENYQVWRDNLGGKSPGFSKWDRFDVVIVAEQATRHNDFKILSHTLDWLEKHEAVQCAQLGAELGHTSIFSLLVDRLFPDPRRRAPQLVPFVTAACEKNHKDFVEKFLHEFDPNGPYFANILVKSVSANSTDVVELLLEKAPPHVLPTGLVAAIQSGNSQIVQNFIPKVSSDDWADVALMALDGWEYQSVLQDRVDDFLLALPSDGYTPMTKVLFNRTSCPLPKARARASQQHLLSELGVTVEQLTTQSSRRF